MKLSSSSSSFFFPVFFLVFCDVASVNVIGRNWSVQDSSLSQVDRLPQRGVVCVPEMGRHRARCQRSLREAAPHFSWTLDQCLTCFSSLMESSCGLPTACHAGCRGHLLPRVNIMKEWSLCPTPLSDSYTQGHWWGLKGRLWSV